MGAPPSMYGKGLRPLSIATVVAFAVTLSLIFFYAPIEADQGFLQKIFYLHVPLAIISLCGFIVGGIFAVLHLRRDDPRYDAYSYVSIHMSVIFGVVRPLRRTTSLAGPKRLKKCDGWSSRPPPRRTRF